LEQALVIAEGLKDPREIAVTQKSLADLLMVVGERKEVRAL